MNADAVLAALPSSGMNAVEPEDCLELLRLCTVMNWRPKIPLLVMRDDSAGRWFMKGNPGQQDYWIRDIDIAVLRSTPMWPAVATAKPYGLEPYDPGPIVYQGIMDESVVVKVTPGTITATVVYDGNTAEDKDDALDMYVALAQKARDDPVASEKRELAKARLEAEAQLKKLDEWE